MASSSFDSLLNSYTRDLSLVPEISFTFVENYTKENSVSSGREQTNKGFKYYSENYVHSVAVYRDETGCLVKGKCFRSQKKNESPHDVKILINNDKVQYAFCSCTIGKSGHCGHVTALLYQLAYYKQMKLPLIPTDIARLHFLRPGMFLVEKSLRGIKLTT